MRADTSNTCAQVLVVEDDAALSEVVCTFLTNEGYAVTPAFSGSEALSVANSTQLSAQPLSSKPGSSQRSSQVGSPFDLVLLDLMLPGIPGEKLIGHLRETLGNVPVIVISARSAVTDRVQLLRLGANDYLVKPFDLDELLARIEVQLREHGRARGTSPSILRFGRWELNPETHAFTVDAQPVRLTRTEFDLLAAMMREPDKVFTKQALFELVRNEEALSDERTIATHISNLRTKLRPSGTDSYLATVWGIGFKLQIS